MVLDFFATWCPPCGPEMANLLSLREAYTHEDVFLVSITQETDQTAIVRFWNRYDGAWPVVMDPNLTATREYGIVNLPTVLVLAPDGSQTLRHVGLTGEHRLTDAVDAAMGAPDE